jgi:outer membrane protein OmpA-like peptidoglycan-associated protein
MMLANQWTLTLAMFCLGSGACAHDTKSRERASVSAVTNEEVADNRAEQGKTRMHYTEVGNEEALGQNNPNAGSELASGKASTDSPGAAGTAAEPQACELAVYFDTDSSRLDQGSQERLDRVAECMKRREVDHATIVGQTDPSGEERHNDKLGLERARVVAEYLRGRGVPEEQIRVRSKGELASAQSQELWPVERRAGVEVAPRR